jgi:hypothetical protein
MQTQSEQSPCSVFTMVLLLNAVFVEPVSALNAWQLHAISTLCAQGIRARPVGHLCTPQVTVPAAAALCAQTDSTCMHVPLYRGWQQYTQAHVVAYDPLS